MSKEEKPYIIKPSLLNALLPTFIKSFFISIILTTILYIFIFLLKLTGLNIMIFELEIIVLISPVIILTIVPTTIRIIMLKCTTYKFYNHYAEKIFKFIIIRKKSTLYSKITNITTNVDLWDRISKAGDIILHTAEDSTPDLTLKYVKEPENVEKLLHNYIKK
ncbi:PH domain-containing protein [Candidatus Woesearchaeota archaeon]|nr:PH domain-containing protein [Candidatus Woesearchaeota archaeon]